MVPTTLIACDFMVISLFEKDLLVEHVHYIAQFLWVLANMVSDKRRSNLQKLMCFVSCLIGLGVGRNIYP